MKKFYIKIIFKSSSGKLYNMYIKFGEVLKVINGRLRREPKNEQTFINIIPTKSITSIKLIKK